MTYVLIPLWDLTMWLAAETAIRIMSEDMKTFRLEFRDEEGEWQFVANYKSLDAAKEGADKHREETK